MYNEEISSDEREIIEKWRMLKRHHKGHLHVSLKANGSQFYLETTSINEGLADSPSDFQKKIPPPQKKTVDKDKI